MKVLHSNHNGENETATTKINQINIHQKYAMFKYETSFNTWSLQSQAFSDLERLRKKQSLNSSNAKSTDNEKNTTTKNSTLKPTLSSVLWSKEPRVFGMEHPISGKRKYVSTNLGRFMHYYWRECDASKRHFYELIYEGYPCRLYFDLEFCKLSNPHIDTDKSHTLLNEFIQELCYEILQTYQISIDATNIVNLDSSTKTKFSHHLIIHLPNDQLFKDNVECGVFVKRFIGRLAEEIATGVLSTRCSTLAKCLFVNKKENKVKSTTETITKTKNQNDTNEDKDNDATTTTTTNSSFTRQQGMSTTCFVDTGVYTRNRLFRILGSMKYGKSIDSALQISPLNQFPFPKCFDNSKFFVSTTTTPGNEENMDPNQLMDNNDHDDDSLKESSSSSIQRSRNAGEIKEHDWDILSAALSDTFVVPLEKDKRRVSILPLVSPESVTTKTSGNPTSFLNLYPGDTCGTSNTCKIVRSGHSTTHSRDNFIFPKLYDYVDRHLATRQKLNGSIRSWSIYYTSSVSSILSSVDNENTQLTHTGSDTTTTTTNCNMNHSPYNEMMNPMTVSFVIKDNRWCENICRAHKSNNIIWNISIPNMEYWQSCFDPECRMISFRGKVHVLDDVDVISNINEVLSSRNELVEGKATNSECNRDDKEYEASKANGNKNKKYDFLENDDSFNNALANLSLENTAVKSDDPLTLPSLTKVTSTCDNEEDRDPDKNDSGIDFFEQENSFNAALAKLSLGDETTAHDDDD